MVKNVIMNLDLSRASCPDCVTVVILKNCKPVLSYILLRGINLRVFCVKNIDKKHFYRHDKIISIFANQIFLYLILL